MTRTDSNPIKMDSIEEYLDIFDFLNPIRKIYLYNHLLYYFFYQVRGEKWRKEDLILLSDHFRQLSDHLKSYLLHFSDQQFWNQLHKVNEELFKRLEQEFLFALLISDDVCKE